jgi:hypothetical protein
MSTDLQELLETIDAPPARPGFRDLVYETAADRDNRAARQARVALVLVGALCIAAISSTAVLGFGGRTPATYDKTFACAVPVVGGIPVLHFEAAGPFSGKFTSTGWLQLALPSPIGARIQLFSALGAHPGGVTVDTQRCIPAARVPLQRGKLPLLGSFGRNAGLNDNDGDKCFSGGKIVFRLHAVLDKGSVERAQLAVETGTKLHPFIYADWTGRKTQVWAASGACAPES